MVRMATYTVIQDIEAEDKLLGPLSMRQFIYAFIVVALGGVAFMAAKVSPFFVMPFLLPMGFFGLLAAPFGRDQSSEVWLLAKIRFMFKPRRRIWDQSGIKELVTITVPKKVEKYLTDGLDQSQVKSRLTALATTLDSRGWAIKNVASGVFTPPAFATSIASGPQSDRLVGASMLPAAAPIYDAQVTDDILDEQNNPTAQKLESLIDQSEQNRRQQLIATMHQPATPVQPAEQPVAAQAPQNDVWFGQIPQQPVAVAVAPVVAQVPGLDEQKLLEQIRHDKEAAASANSHVKRIPTGAELAEQATAQKTAQEAALAAAAARTEDLKRLAVNDDLNIETIARQAKKDTNGVQVLDDGEVIISLH